MEIKFSIEKNIGIISGKEKGWNKELNIVNWNDKGGKFDIRDWNTEHDKMGKGITLSEDELLKLYELLKDYFNEETVKKTDENKEGKDIQDIFLK